MVDAVKPIGDSWRFLKSNKSVFKPALISAVFTFFVYALFMFVLTSLLQTNPLLYLLLYIVLVVVGLVVGSFVALWTVSIVVKKGKSDYSEPIKRLPSAIGSSLLLSVVLVLGYMALIIPGIYLTIRLLFTSQAIMVDKKKAVESLEHSWALTKNRWFDSFGFFIVLGLACFVFLIPFFIGMVAVLISNPSLFLWFMIIYISAVNIIITPLIYGALTFYYFELKKDKK